MTKWSRTPSAQFAIFFLVLTSGYLPKTIADDEPADAEPTVAPPPPAGGGGGGFKPIELGNFLGCANGLKGSAKLVTKRSVEVTIQNYDQKAEQAYFQGMLKGAKGIAAGEHSHALQVEGKDCGDSSLEKLTGYADAGWQWTLLLPKDITEYKSIGIFDFKDCRNLGHIVVTIAELALISDAGAPEGVTPCPVDTECLEHKSSPFEKCKKAEPRQSPPAPRQMDNKNSTEASSYVPVPAVQTISVGLVTAFGIGLAFTRSVKQ